MRSCQPEYFKDASGERHEAESHRTFALDWNKQGTDDSDGRCLKFA